MFVLFSTLVVVAECCKLPENKDALKELTDAIHRLEVQVSESEETAAKTEAKTNEEMQKISQQNNNLFETIHRIEAKVVEMEVNRDAQVELMKQETNEIITDLSEAVFRLEDKFAETDVKRDEELKPMNKENTGMMTEMNDKLQRQIEDINSLNAKFT